MGTTNLGMWLQSYRGVEEIPGVERHLERMGVAKKGNNKEKEKCRNCGHIDCFAFICILAYLHTCIYVHTCICGYLHMCILTYMYILAYLHTCILAYLHTCIYMHTCIIAYMCKYASMQVCTYARMQVCKYNIGLSS